MGMSIRRFFRDWLGPSEAEIYVVVDWDREEVVGLTWRLQGAESIKSDYCDDKGIAPDHLPNGQVDPSYPRSRVTIEQGEVEDRNG